jgi:hypothetical protein
VGDGRRSPGAADPGRAHRTRRDRGVVGTHRERGASRVSPRSQTARQMGAFFARIRALLASPRATRLVMRVARGALSNARRSRHSCQKESRAGRRSERPGADTTRPESTLRQIGRPR